MTDRELLEYAAKAADMWVEAFSLNDDDLPDFHKERGFRLAYGRGWWNPLTDDGDALRLAVRLGMDTYHADDEGRAVYASYPTARGITYAIEPYSNDPYAATRRAIVRAAAEIGRGME